MKLEVSVSEEDIETGTPYAGEYDKCPIAICLKKLGCENVDVDEDRVLLTYDGKRYIYKTPRSAMLFIDDFDRDNEVKPITFVLENPKLATPEDERPSLLTDYLPSR